MLTQILDQWELIVQLSAERNSWQSRWDVANQHFSQAIGELPADEGERLRELLIKSLPADSTVMQLLSDSRTSPAESTPADSEIQNSKTNEESQFGGFDLDNKPLEMGASVESDAVGDPPTVAEDIEDVLVVAEEVVAEDVVAEDVVDKPVAETSGISPDELLADVLGQQQSVSSQVELDASSIETELERAFQPSETGEESVGGESVGGESVGGESVGDESVGDESVGEEAVLEGSAVEDSVTVEAVSEEAVSEEELYAEMMAAMEAEANEKKSPELISDSAAEESDVEKIASEKTVAETMAEESANEEPIAEEPIAEEPVAEEPVAEEPVAEAPAEETLIANENSNAEPSAEEVIAQELAELRIWAIEAIGEGIAENELFKKLRSVRKAALSQDLVSMLNDDPTFGRENDLVVVKA